MDLRDTPIEGHSRSGSKSFQSKLPDQNNGFLEACLLETAQLVKLQVRHSDDVQGDGHQYNDPLIHRSG
jgi:hypothetical protein